MTYAAELAVAPECPGDPKYGYFGPDSLPWQLFEHPCIAAGAVYNAVIFELFPPCAILSDQVDSLYVDPIGRARRTLGYVYSVIYGDTDTADRAAAYVRDLHDRIPAARWAPTGSKKHRVSDPENLLWLHMTNGDGALRSHAAYGVGRLTAGELDDFWRQLAPFAELQGVPLDLIPRSSDAADLYFERMWPQLAVTAAGRRAFEQVLNPKGISWQLAPIKVPLGLVVRSGIALLPEDVLQLIGMGGYQPAIAASRVVARQLYRGLRAPGGRDLLPKITLPDTRKLMSEARLR